MGLLRMAQAPPKKHESIAFISIHKDTADTKNPLEAPMSTHRATPELQPHTGMDAEVYRPLAPDHRHWLRRLPSLLAPSREEETWLSRAVSVFFVVPFAPLTPFDLDYQTYLYEVFHRSVIARVSHFVLFPLVNLAVFVGLAGISLGAPHAVAHGPDPFVLNLSAVFAVLLAVWYTALAARVRSVVWGGTLLLAVAGLWAAGNTIHGLTFELDAAQRTVLSPSPLLFNPWLWAAGLSFLIAASHVREPDVPPRVSGTDAWVPLDRWLAGESSAHLSLLARYRRLGRQLVFGAFAEFLAAQRLMPIALLRMLWAIGLARDVRPGVNEARRALQQGQPALDYMGHGGGTRLRAKKAS